MTDRQQQEKTNEQRRKEFAPHENPKKQADGDSGPNSASAREKPVDERGAESPQSVQDDATED